MNPTPFAPLFDSPRDLLNKAARDLERLEVAIRNDDNDGRRDALMEACCAAYHVWEWIAYIHSKLAADTKAFGEASDAISLCRDVCNGAKHFELNRNLEIVLVERVDYTRGPASSVAASAGLDDWVGDVPKIRSDTIPSRGAPDVIATAITEWDGFLRQHGL